MASTACPAKVCSRVGMVGAKAPTVRRRITSPPTTLSSRNNGTARTAWMPFSCPITVERRILLHVLDMHGRPLYRGAAEMGPPIPDLPFAQCLDPFRAHAKGGFGHEKFSRFVEFVDRAF